jgi:DNA-binding SARP family transcriptional activator
MTWHRAARRVWWILAGTCRILGRVARGLIAATMLLAVAVVLPWAMWHFVGWPLPDHIPTWTEIELFLLSPMTTTFLLDFIVCWCWIFWAGFTLSVLRCAAELIRDGIEVARSQDWSASGPLNALAGVLVGTLLVSVLGNRASAAPTAASFNTETYGAQVVATSPAWPGPEQDGEVPSSDSSPAAGTTTHPTSVTVRAPHNGVHDSLWRIAQRTLGDGTRWPEIYELNKGTPQPNGRTFTAPSLIFPGQELALPAGERAQPEPPQPPPPPVTTTPPTTSQSSSPTPSIPQPPISTDTNTTPGFTWGPGLFVGFGLVAAVSTALMAARFRYRSQYRPGSGDRSDLPVAPVVYQLRLAHLREQSSEDDGIERPRRAPALPAVVVGADDSAAQPALVAGLGVRDGREIALNLAAARGLGLVGAGAPAAARALLLATITTPTDLDAGTPHQLGTRVVVPADDLDDVLDRYTAHAHLPTAIQVATSLEDALDALEAETLVRATASREQTTAAGTWLAMVLVARPPEHQRQRLQAVLDDGAQYGITGLLLGQWQPGVTAYVRDDGTISATSPGLGEALRGTRMFHLGDDDATDLLALLRQAQPDTTSPTSGPDVQDELEILGTTPVPIPAEDPLPAPMTSLMTEEHVAHPALTLTVFGAPTLRHTASGAEAQDITAALQPRMRELLVFLALHPTGATRETLVGTLWADSPPQRPTNALNTTLSRLRRTLATATDSTVGDIVTARDGRYRLDSRLMHADYWDFADAVSARRGAADEPTRVAAYREIVDNYGGVLAEGITAEWLDPVREASRRDAVDAASALARALVATDPQQTLDLLEIVRAFDTHNEGVYRDIMRLQHKLGLHDAIPRTLALLTTRLAELDAQPDAQTRELAQRLTEPSRHHDHAAVQ